MIANVDVQIAVDDATVPKSTDLINWVCRALEAAGEKEPVDVSVRVVGEAEMRELNGTFRQQDKPTNVLSFSSGDIEGLPPGSERPLGDIVVCAAVVSDEAAEQQKTPENHWAHMMIHGTLHLLGFDHEDDAEAKLMEGLEVEILSGLGIANPYTDAHNCGAHN